jgi:cytidylate kinase
MTVHLQRHAEALGVSERPWENKRRRDQGTTKAFTIALAREAGTAGALVAAAVGRQLGWPVYDQELVEKIAQELGLRSQLLESVDERRKGWIREMVESFVSVPGITEPAYVRHLTQTVLSLGTHGDCVIVGRGAAHILPPETTLRVRVIADLADRIAAASRRQNMSKEQAARWVADTDRERAAFVRAHFFKDAAEPHNYDLVLNASRWSVEECARFIVDGLRAIEKQQK